MRSSKKITVAAWVIIFVLVFKLADFALYPCTFTRNDIHTVTTEYHDDIFIGTSHGKMSICPEEISKVTGRSCHNLCVGGEYPKDAYHLIKLLEEKQCPKRVIYEVDPGYFMVEKEQGNNYMLFYHEYPFSKAKAEYFKNSMTSCDIRTMLMPWYEYDIKYELHNMKDTISKKLTKDYSEESLRSENQRYYKDGFIERYPVDISGDEVKVQHLFYEEYIKKSNMEYLEKIIDFCKEKDIEFVAVTTPLPDVTLETYSENFDSAQKYFEDFFSSKEVTYYNFNGKYHDYALHDISVYTDYDGHMNGEGARAFSRIFSIFL